MQWMLTSSLQKVFSDWSPCPLGEDPITVLKNQRGAFQIAFKGPGEVRLSLEGLPAYAAYQVVPMPSAYPCHEARDHLYLKTEPGLYPDLLKPVTLPLNLSAEEGWQAVWISFEDLTPGDYRVRILLNGEEKLLSLRVLDLELPEQKLWHTEWFHGDCLADYYGVEVFSPGHWQALEGFIRAAARCGVNMLLTPLFTPPLDTEPGGERTTIQLVDVFYENGAYTFHFENLRRWIIICQKYGITEIEFSHLFTQWGAEAAPKIMVWEHGKKIKKFGWDSPAAGGDYEAFLRVFLPALKEELLCLGVWDHCWFHISDEPAQEQKDSYAKAKEIVRDFLPEQRCMDAISSFDFYKYGYIKTPVVCEDHLEPFLEAKVPGLFTYYCTAQGVKVPNRFFSMSSGRNRILGVLLYVYDLRGFLHWGFNFYNSQFSKAHIDPFSVTDAGGAFPSGDPFLVYPGPDFTPWYSLRSEVLYEGLQDLRLLQLAEGKLGRQAVLELIDWVAGYRMTFFKYPVSEDFFRQLQREILKNL